MPFGEEAPRVGVCQRADPSSCQAAVLKRGLGWWRCAVAHG